MLIHYYRLGIHRSMGDTAAESVKGAAEDSAALDSSILDSSAADRPASQSGAAGGSAAARHAAGPPPVRPTFQTWVDTAGPLQKQLLLDYEEDRLCVVRQVSRYGSIGGRRLWPSAEPEYTDMKDSGESA